MTPLNIIKKYKHAWIIPVFGILYMMGFTYLEQRNNVRFHIIHMKIDDAIPFCEYFIVPYFLWFAFIAATVFYFTFINKNKADYYRLITALGIGMTLFLVISYVYPNAQDLRPVVFARDNLFVDMVKHLYRIDTPTNILPSIHVFNSVAACTAIFKCEGLKKHRAVRGGTLVLTVLIVLATVFLKQHTLLDVITAFALYFICYQVIYKPRTAPQKAKAAEAAAK